MRAIVIVMLVVQAAMLLTVVWTMLFARPSAGQGRRPVWSSLAISLVIVGAASWNIGESREGQPGADIVMYIAPLLLGMGLMAALMSLRQRRGLDGPA
jgi:hypothetical protein